MVLGLIVAQSIIIQLSKYLQLKSQWDDDA